MEAKLFLIQEFESEEARDKALKKVSNKIPCYFADSEQTSWNLIN